MRRTHNSLAGLLLLLLLLLLLHIGSAVDIDTHPCTRLAQLHPDKVRSWGERRVSVRGAEVHVTLYWGSEPARAASALLAALLRHVRRYARVRLARAPHRTADLARHLVFNSRADYNELAIGLSTAWEPQAAQAWLPFEGMASGLAGPRLTEFGLSPVAARRRLHAWLVPAARRRAGCRHVLRSLYTNLTALLLCGFVDDAPRRAVAPAVELVGVGDCDDTLHALLRRADAAAIPLTARLVNRTEFMSYLRIATRSFLFLDYDIWKGEANVTVVEPPPCVPLGSDCQQELESAIAMRVADVDILQTYAPQLFRFVHDFTLTPQDLRFLLERETSGVHIEQAACEWALNNKYNYLTYEAMDNYDMTNYSLAIYLCDGDPYNNVYDNITLLVSPKIHEQTSKMGFNISYRRFFINCSNVYHMSKRLEESTSTVGVYRLLGVVSMTVEGAAAASASAAAHRVPLLLADVVPDEPPGEPAAAPDSRARPAAWRVAGRPRHLALALHHFMLVSDWTRLAVLTQPTALADNYYSALQDRANFTHRQFRIPLNLTKTQAENTLNMLQVTNARIIFINADSEAAAVVLAAAFERRMSYLNGFVWIVREWRQDALTHNDECTTKHFSVSFWSRGHPQQQWPPRAEALVNALRTLALGFKDIFQRYPDTRQDLRSDHVMRSLDKSLVETPVIGFNQTLHYKERSIEETFVYVDEWCGGHLRRRLATWRVNVSSGVVSGSYARPVDMPRHDGRARCLLRAGDAFHPDCHDLDCICALLLLLLALAGLALTRRALRRRLARLHNEQNLKLIARRQHVAAVLAAYVVQRDALVLHEEIGAGRFGSVRLAQLLAPPHSPRYIAAKALRENAAPAEESEFLREACTIASLEHAHIVRLVGVCIEDGPPLVLMELAFFGDLHEYLRARRHLALEAAEACGEAAHVAADALTRLAREAADALRYLGARGVVHRDVRAANCLVDARRSLKLADFGMARDTVAGAAGPPEYACRRRGLFPVLWMAPESLAHGVFSAASDVWALGVLVLELVTLGARPYGAWPPLRVMEYVAAGGLPPLPPDASPQTRGLVRLCWQREAERRPSAGEVAAYLRKWPRALRPALLSERDELADADSGFGESPSTELLSRDYPLHSVDQFDDLVVTH